MAHYFKIIDQGECPTADWYEVLGSATLLVMFKVSDLKYIS